MGDLARLFDDGSSEYLENTTAAPVLAVPLTMAAWFYCDDVTTWTDRNLVSIQDKDTEKNYFQLRLRAGDTEIVRAHTRSAAAQGGATSTAEYNVNTWHHAAAIFSATDARAVYLDGANKGTENTDITPVDLDSVSIGRLGDSSPDQYMSGGIFLAAIWNVALTDAEVALLAAKHAPLCIRPENLMAFWPLTDTVDDSDWLGGFDLTAFNTPGWMTGPTGIMYPVKPMLAIY